MLKNVLSEYQFLLRANMIGFHNEEWNRQMVAHNAALLQSLADAERQREELRGALAAIRIPEMVDEDGYLWLHILLEGGKRGSINLGQPGPIVCAAINDWMRQRDKALS